jgi:RimJ/RimL family protein N-acetyltransferase
MRPVTLLTRRLELNQPNEADLEAVVEYCRDPLSERFLTIPWPYEPAHAEAFVTEHVPSGWDTGAEFTWALRRDGELLGMIGIRMPSRMIGYWLGRPHRGNGYMTEAVSRVADWVFSIGTDAVLWEAVIGNWASASVARRAGFSFTGEGTAVVPSRDGSLGTVWQGRLDATDSRDPKPGWPRA